MRNLVHLLVIATLAFGFTPGVGAAEETATQEDVMVSCGASPLWPPCGWINPQLSLQLPDAKSCPDDSGGVGCLAPPTTSKPTVYEGEFVLKWEISEEGTYASDVNDPVVVTFRGTGSNPSFLDFTIEPATFELDSVTLANPQYHTTKENSDGSDSVWYEYRQPVTVTVTRAAEEPSPDDIERIERRGGEIQFLIRIHSDGSGSTFKDSYGLKAFYFHVGAERDDGVADAPMDALNPNGEGPAGAETNSTPVASVPFVLAGLAALAAVIRRRN
jgi:hypothetical protein